MSAEPADAPVAAPAAEPADAPPAAEPLAAPPDAPPDAAPAEPPAEVAAVAADRSRSRSKSARPRDDRSRSRSRDRRRRGSRSRSRSRRRRRSRSRSRSLDRRDRRRRRSPSPQHRRGRGAYGHGRAAPRTRAPPPSAEDELARLDRTTRTVQAYNLPSRAEERDVFDFFSRAGALVDIKILRDRATGRSRGLAYVEFKARESVVAALSLTGAPLLGQPVMVKTSEAEKNVAWEAARAAKAAGLPSAPAGVAAAYGYAPVAAAAAPAPPAGPCQLAVAGLHPSIAEADLRPIFDPFGALDFVAVSRDALGASLGTALVQYRLTADAARAAEQLDGLDIGGALMRVGGAPADAAAAMAAAAAGGAPPAAAAGGGAAAPPPPPAELEERIETEGTDGGGMKLTAASRAALMGRLAAGAGLTMPAAAVAAAAPMPPPGAPPPPAPVPHELALARGLLGPASPIPTPCLLLKNMFDPAAETEEGWPDEIAGEVREEAAKFGAVDFLFVDAASAGHVYVRFADAAGAAAAKAALHGRWFAGKQVAADFQFAQLFAKHFGL
jgi:RNA-binding protein 39